MKSEYDVIIVGAGPAGSMAAMAAAREGLDVLMIEKRQEIGEPVRCAEGLINERLDDLIEFDQKWVCADIKRACIHAPKGKTLKFSQETTAVYVVDRKIFDRALARQAANSGSEIFVKTHATGLIIDDGMVKGIRGTYRGKEFEAHSKIVIGADGIESKVGRWAGLLGPLRLKDIESCAEFTLCGIDIDQECLEFYVGNGISPGGYLWIFPKGRDEANVGLGMLGTRINGMPPIEYLKRFIDGRFPEGKVLQAIVGAVPVCDVYGRISTGGLMLAGDGARLADPLSGAGILNALVSGRIAGRRAVEAIRDGDLSSGALKKYDDEIMKCMGNTIHRNYRLKEFVVNATDRQMDLVIYSMRKARLENVPLSRILSMVISSDRPVLGMVRSAYLHRH